MSDDGAHLGVNAARALDTVLGGAGQPASDERMDPVQMEAYLLDAPLGTDQSLGYEGCARAAGRLVLEFFKRHPECARLPADDKYDFPRDFDWNTPHEQWPLVQEGVYTVLPRLEPEAGKALEDLGLTGFQWGWAVNAARYCCELPPTPNPAIVIVG